MLSDIPEWRRKAEYAAACKFTECGNDPEVRRLINTVIDAVEPFIRNDEATQLTGIPRTPLDP